MPETTADTSCPICLDLLRTSCTQPEVRGEAWWDAVWLHLIADHGTPDPA
ncbi:hypothetical protein [Streptomyces sp. NBC_01304]|nr:hypothetical protein OG430_44640 [Streptomyces sp. NBC_01304]